MRVSYIPSQLEASATVALTLRESPGKLLVNDIKLVIKLFRLLPWILIPWRGDINAQQSSLTERNTRDGILHISILILTLSSIGFGVKLATIATGSAFLAYSVVCWILLMLLCRPMNHGPRVLRSKASLDGFPSHPREKWIFVNGICSGTRGLQESLDLISSLFKRPVVGVHNRTYGLIFDLIECLIQRDFAYMTSDIRITYNTIKETLLDESVDRVVVIAHSQGGIIISAATDALYADLPPVAFDKLEIYTFGCAANHFNNPPRCTQCHNGSCTGLATDIIHLQRPATKRQIAVVEHYVNEHDFVGRLGVLRFVKGRPVENQFVGKVFTRLGVGGHLFGSHYLLPMFGKAVGGFLDEVVVVEMATAVERGAAAAARKVPNDDSSADGNGDGDDEEEVVGGVFGLKTGLVAEGSTVAQLSRLWKYLDGAIPE